APPRLPPAGPVGPGDPRDGGGLGGRPPPRDRRQACLRPRLRARHRARRRGGEPRERRVLDQPGDRARVDAQGPDRDRAGRAGVGVRHVRGRRGAGVRRGPERHRVRRALPGGRRAPPVLLRARGPARGAVRPAVSAALRRLEAGPGVVPVVLLAVLGLAPLVVTRQDWLNLGVVYFLAVALAQSWNVMGGLTGQVNLGHAAFFG